MSLRAQVLRYALPRTVAPALLPLLAALLLPLCTVENSVFYAVFLPAAALALLLPILVTAILLYRSFPREADGTTVAGYLLVTGAIGDVLSSCVTLLAARLVGAIGAIPAARSFSEELRDYANAAIVFFFFATVFLLSLLAAAAFTVLWAKKAKKRGAMSRTCLCAVPVFTGVALFYCLVTVLASFTTIDNLSNLASEGFFTENLLWLTMTLGTGGLLLAPLLTVPVLRMANTRRAKK